MRVEYLADGSPDCPLIRLSHFTAAEAASLASAAAALATGQAERVALHELLEIEAAGHCELVLLRLSWDQAVVRIGPMAFECGLTADSWDNVAGLIEPFMAGRGGHQWLTGAPGEASLLLSACGQW